VSTPEAPPAQACRAQAVAANMRRYREQAGLTQYQLAARIDRDPYELDMPTQVRILLPPLAGRAGDTPS
jgi:hypothetical protein